MNCVQVRELVPESQAYMDLLSFEQKLDSTITRKKLDIQVPSAIFHLPLNASFSLPSTFPTGGLPSEHSCTTDQKDQGEF